MEEHVLFQMLSGQKSVRTERIRERIPESPPTAHMRRRSAGSRTPAPVPAELMNAGLSPVTPARVRAPTNTEVSLAEMTSAVVIAAERDKRQRDAIRRLAHQNECLERENLDLQTSGRRERRLSSGTTRSAGTGANSNKDVDLELERELKELRREKREWQRRDKARRKEERAMADKFEDITQSAKRVLSERDSHLRTIAALSQELHEVRTNTATVTGTGNTATADVPIGTGSVPKRRPSIPAPPAFSETSHSAHSTRHEHGNHYRRLDVTDASTPRVDRELHAGIDAENANRDSAPHATPRSTQSERITRTKTQVPTTRTGGDSLPLPSTIHENSIRSAHSQQGVHTAHTVRGEEASPSHSYSRSQGSEHEVTETRRALHDELNELAAENRKLRAENRELKPAASNSSAGGTSSAELALVEVDEELGMLETVVNAMDLSITTNEVRDKQETMTLIEQTLPHGGTRGDTRGGIGACAQLSVRELAQRLGNVRKMIAEKYGRYLRDYFTTDESLTLPQGAALPPMPDDTMISLPSKDHRQFPGVGAFSTAAAAGALSQPMPWPQTESAQQEQLQYGLERSDEQVNGFTNEHPAASDILNAETALVVYSPATNVRSWHDGVEEYEHVEE